MYESDKDEKAYQKIRIDVINYCRDLYKGNILSYESAKRYIRTVYSDIDNQSYERLIKAVCNFINV